MSRAGSLLKNTGILFVAKATTQVINFLLLPVYTAVLSTAEYGEIDLYATSAMIILPLVTLQLEQAVFRYLVGIDDNAKRSRIVTSGFASMFAAVAVISSVYAPVVIIAQLPHAVLTYCYYLTLAITAMLLQLCRGFGDNVGYSVGSFMAAIIALVLNIVFVAILLMSVPGALLATALANLATAIYLAARTKLFRYISPSSFSSTTAMKMLRYSAPLIFNQVSSWAVNYSNRLIMLGFLGMGANGIYAVASKFSNALSTVYGVYNLAWTENMVLYSKDADYDEYVSRMTTKTTRAYLGLVTLILSFLPILFPIFVNESYRDSYYQVPLLLLGMMLSGMAATLGSIYIVHEKTLSVALTTCVSGIASIVINVALVNAIKLYAAGIAMVASFGIMFFYRYWKMQKFQSLHIHWSSLGIDALACALALVLYITNQAILALVLGLIVCAYALKLLHDDGLLGVAFDKAKGFLN